MEWVFGNTLICKDADAAKRVTFDRNVRMKSVTVDGDVYDPFGTLSGGSKPNSAGILVRVQELNGVRQQIKQHKETLAKVEQELSNSQRVISDYKRRKQMLDLKAHEIHLLEDRLRQSTHSQVWPVGEPPLFTDFCLLIDFPNFCSCVVVAGGARGVDQGGVADAGEGYCCGPASA
jgi:hypothetical protein